MVILGSKFKNVFTAPLRAVVDLFWSASFRRSVKGHLNDKCNFCFLIFVGARSKASFAVMDWEWDNCALLKPFVALNELALSLCGEELTQQR
jgi:hypothetical protein